MTATPGRETQKLFVDGLNLLGSRPDGWWRDRPRAMRRLLENLVPVSERWEVTVVFDGKPHARVESASPAAVEVVFAPGGPNAADKEIVRRIRRLEDPGAALVVSSDRRLRASVKAAGAHSIGSLEFRREHLAPEAGPGRA